MSDGWRCQEGEISRTKYTDLRLGRLPLKTADSLKKCTVLRENRMLAWFAAGGTFGETSFSLREAKARGAGLQPVMAAKMATPRFL